MSISRSTKALGAALALLWAATASAQQATPAGQPSAPPRCDVNCVRENAAKAAELCAPRIEAQSPSDFDWISRPNPGIFQQADPSSPSDSIVRYRGDSVRFMSQDKSWTRVSYECGYDVSAQTVTYVHVRSGRLDQPLAPSGARSQPAAPAKPVVAQNAPAAAPAMNPPASPQTSAAHPPKARVWEPSLVVIQQQSANPTPH
jgi:hypothetical protein